MGVKVAFLEEALPVVDEAELAEVRPRLLAPSAAVRRDGERDIVFVVHDGTVERRAVTVGARRGQDVEIEAGLVSGESVVVDPPEGLADGDAVRPSGER